MPLFDSAQQLEYRSIQVGIGRGIVAKYVEQWTVTIEDVTPLVAKLRALCADGEHDRAAALLPVERLYPLSEAIRARLRATA